MLVRMLAAALALIGALVYGAADFLGGLAAKRLRAIVVTAVAAGAGLVILAAAAPFTVVSVSASDIAWGATSGVVGFIALMLLYGCLAIGPMSILSPLTAVVSAITPMLWGLLVDGDQLSPIAFVGLGLALVAVVLVGFVPGERVVRPSARGLAMAVGAGLAIGGFLIVIDQTGPESGLVPLVANRATSVVVTGAIVAGLVVSAMRRGRTAASALVSPPGPGGASRRVWMLAIGCGLLDAAANALLLFALREGQLSVVSALTALYPAGTILLAAFLLRERVAAVQWVGLALAVAAGGMLALA
jgi:uncharacterized membrane protein